MKPILFSTPMVQAILEGRKTQTQRVINEFKHVKFELEKYDEKSFYVREFYPNGTQVCMYEIQPKYYVGDILWVRETFTFMDSAELAVQKDEYLSQNNPINGYAYKADYSEEFIRNTSIKWKPSTNMPRYAARIFLLVKNVKAERLQEIREKDAIAEGFYSNERVGSGTPYDGAYLTYCSPVELFEAAWWVYEFERVENHEQDK